MANDNWATPLNVYRAMDREFGFCADMAASDDNHKHHIYWTEQDSPNSLEMNWANAINPLPGGAKWVWTNPPYSKIGPWVDKAIQAQAGGVGVVMLVMADTSVKWYSKAIKYASEVRFVTGGRIAFLENGKPKGGNNKGSKFLIFAPNMIGTGLVTHISRKELLAKGADIAEVIEWPESEERINNIAVNGNNGEHYAR